LLRNRRKKRVGKEDKTFEDLDIFLSSGSNPEFFLVSLKGASS